MNLVKCCGKNPAPSILELQDFRWLVSNAGYASNNVAETLIVDGEIDRDLLNGALKALIQKHDGLRTRFSSGEDSECIRTVETRLDQIPLIEHGLVDISTHQCKELIREFNDHRFEPSDFPLWRAVVAYDPAKNQTVFGFVVQHIICDGHSMGILLGDTSEFYMAAKGPGGLAKDSNEYSLKDYIYSHNTWVQDSGIEKSVDWIINKHADDIDNIEPAPEHLQNRTSAPLEATLLYSKLTDRTHEQSIELCSKTGIAPNTLYLALGAIAVGAALGKANFACPVAYSGRHIPHTEDLVGRLYSQLPLFINLHDTRTFTELLQAISRDWLLLTYRLGLVPMGILHEHIYPDIAYMKAPSPITASLLNIIPESNALSNFLGKSEEVRHEERKYYLTVNSMQVFLYTSANGLEYSIKAPIAHLAYYKDSLEHIDRIFTDVLANPDAQLLDLLGNECSMNSVA